MRVALLHWTRRRAGGAEVTLAACMAGIVGAGHELALWYEMDHPVNRPTLPLPDGAPSWCVDALGANMALAALRAWKPDVLLVHGLLQPKLERAALQSAPGVFFAHSYYGTCISGTKAFTFPRTRPCQHRFGWACLLRYYPRRVGGLNPVTMVREYRRQAHRLATLRGYQLVLVLSEHMRSEYVRHGFSPERVVRLPFPPVIVPSDASDLAQVHPRRLGDPWHLLFVGRMDPLKGGSELLAAAPRVARSLGAALELSFVGDGPARRTWEDQAAALAPEHSTLTVRFRGWLGEQELQTFYRHSDLIVVPSLWPEPFGRTGLEAAAYGLPCAAFGVGGIREWLTEGVNGAIAPGDPPTAAGLAAAITRAFDDPRHYAALRLGALAVARQTTDGAFVRAIVAALERAAGWSGN